MVLSELIPADAVTGSGLALRHRGRYLFMLAGSRYERRGESTFYAGIGGHCEPGESWLDCARREAMEELGAEVAIRPAVRAAYIARDARARAVVLDDDPCPLAVYELWNPPDSPWNTRGRGHTYYVVIYEATLDDAVAPQPHDLDAILWLTPAQVVRTGQAPMRLQTLLDDGATIVAKGAIPTHWTIRPQGTAHALSILWASDNGCEC